MPWSFSFHRGFHEDHKLLSLQGAAAGSGAPAEPQVRSDSAMCVTDLGFKLCSPLHPYLEDYPMHSVIGIQLLCSPQLQHRKLLHLATASMLLATLAVPSAVTGH